MTSGWPEDRRDLRWPSGENDDTAAEARARGRLATQTGPQNPVSPDASGYGAAHPGGPPPVGSLPHPSGPLPVGPMPPSRGRFGLSRSREDQVDVAPSDADYDWIRYLGEAGPAQGAAPSGRGPAGAARPDRQTDTNPRAASRPAVTDPLAGTARPAVTNWPAVTDPLAGTARPAATNWPAASDRLAGADRPATDRPATDGPGFTGRPVTHRRVTDPSITDPSITGRSATDGPAVTGRHVTHRRVTDPSITDPSITDSSITDPSITNRPGVAGRHVTHRRVTDPPVSSQPGVSGWPVADRPLTERTDVTGRHVSDRRISHRRVDDPGQADGAPRQAAGPGAATAFTPPTPSRERPGPAQPESASGPWPTERGWSPSRRQETAPRGANPLTRPVGGPSARPAERPFVRPDERPGVREAERSSGPAAWPVDDRPRRPGQAGLGHRRLTAAIDTGPETARSPLEPGEQSLRGRRGPRRQPPAAYASPMDASGPIQTISKDPEAAGPALTKRAARARARRRHRTLLRVIGLVVAVAIVPATAAAVLRSGLLRSGGPQHTISIPARMLGYTEEPALAKGMDAPALRADIVKKGNGEASHVVDGVYEDNASTGTKSSPLIILFIGGNLSGSATSFIASFTGMVPGAFATSAGKLGGQAACVPGTAGRPAECAWADNDTFGLFASPTLSASALGAELRAMRPLVEHQHKSA